MKDRYGLRISAQSLQSWPQLQSPLPACMLRAQAAPSNRSSTVILRCKGPKLEPLSPGCRVRAQAAAALGTVATVTQDPAPLRHLIHFFHQVQPQQLPPPHPQPVNSVRGRFDPCPYQVQPQQRPAPPSQPGKGSQGCFQLLLAPGAPPAAPTPACPVCDVSQGCCFGHCFHQVQPQHLAPLCPPSGTPVWGLGLTPSSTRSSPSSSPPRRSVPRGLGPLQLTWVTLRLRCAGVLRHSSCREGGPVSRPASRQRGPGAAVPACPQHCHAPHAPGAASPGPE